MIRAPPPGVDATKSTRRVWSPTRPPPGRAAFESAVLLRAHLLTPGGGPRIIADVVTADCVDSANPAKSATHAGHAVALAARSKERKYADHPPGDVFAALAIDVFRMRLAVSLQRSLAQAVHARAGRAMAAASGSRQSASFPATSYSDLLLLTRLTELPSTSPFLASLPLALDIVHSFWLALPAPSSLWASTSSWRLVSCLLPSKKAAKHSDHPPADEFVPLAVDVHGALGSQWLDLLARLARRAVSRRRGEPADFNAAGSWAQVYRMRLSVSLQRSMAHALHLRAGRALAAGSGFRQGDSFLAASLSDLRLLTPILCPRCPHARRTRSGRCLRVSAECLLPCLELLGPDVAHSRVLSFPTAGDGVTGKLVEQFEPPGTQCPVCVDGQREELQWQEEGWREGEGGPAARGTVPFRHLAHTPDLRAQARFTALVEKAASDQAVELLPPSDVRGRARLLSASSPGAAAWLQALPLYAALTMPDEVYRTAVHRLLGLLPPCLTGVTQCECGARHADPAELAAHMLRCAHGGERTASHDLLRDGMQGVFIEAGFKVAVECSSVMPILRGEDGRSHTRRADLPPRRPPSPHPRALGAASGARGREVPPMSQDVTPRASPYTCTPASASPARRSLRPSRPAAPPPCPSSPSPGAYHGAAHIASSPGAAAAATRRAIASTAAAYTKPPFSAAAAFPAVLHPASRVVPLTATLASVPLLATLASTISAAVPATFATAPPCPPPSASSTPPPPSPPPPSPSGPAPPPSPPPHLPEPLLCQHCQKSCNSRSGRAHHERACARHNKRAEQAQSAAAAGSRRGGPGRPVPSWLASLGLAAVHRRAALPLLRHVLHRVRPHLRHALCLVTQRIVTDHRDEAAWKLFILFPWLLLGRASPESCKQGQQPILEHVQLFESGHWEELLARYDAAVAASAANHGGKGAAPDRAASVCWALRFGHADELSWAVQALDDEMLAPTNAARRAALDSLHFPARSPLPPWLATFAPPEEPPRSSRRPLPHAHEHLREIFLEGEAADFQALLQICQLLARDHVAPASIRGVLCTSTLLALDKLSREPIAIGEVLYRLVSRVLWQQHAGLAQMHLAPHQYSAGLRIGGKAVVHEVHATLDQHPGWLVLAVDVRDAFNCVGRDSIAEELQDTFPSLVPLFRLGYGQPGDLLWRTGDDRVEILHCKTGIRQGDPLAGFYFVLAHNRACRSPRRHTLGSCCPRSPMTPPWSVPPQKWRQPSSPSSSSWPPSACPPLLDKCAAWSPCGHPSTLALPPRLHPPGGPPGRADLRGGAAACLTRGATPACGLTSRAAGYAAGFGHADNGHCAEAPIPGEGHPAVPRGVAGVWWRAWRPCPPPGFPPVACRSSPGFAAPWPRGSWPPPARPFLQGGVPRQLGADGRLGVPAIPCPRSACVGAGGGGGDHGPAALQVSLRSAHQELLVAHLDPAAQAVSFEHLAHTADARVQARFTAAIDKAAFATALQQLPALDLRRRARLLDSTLSQLRVL
eukprot:SM000129S26142  [mRNA]  locus=s129:217520:227198:+ [translate_table: standard]